MLEVMHMSVEKLLLSLIVGGMIIMVVCVRPLLSQHLQPNNRTEFGKLIEGISIQAWNRYNRVAFVSIALLLILDFIQFAIGNKYSYWDLVIETIILFLLLLKFTLDKSLMKRLMKFGNDAVQSAEQNKGHRLVEMLSKFILILSIILIILPSQG